MHWKDLWFAALTLAFKATTFSTFLVFSSAGNCIMAQHKIQLFLHW